MARWALKILWGEETAVQFWRICSERSARLASASFKVKWQDLNKLISPFRGKRWVKNWSPTACSILTLAVPTQFSRGVDVLTVKLMFGGDDLLRHLPRPLKSTSSIPSTPQCTGCSHLKLSCYWSALLLPRRLHKLSAHKEKRKLKKASSSNAHSLLLSSCWRHTDQLLGLNQQPLSCSRYLFWLCLQGYHDKVLLGSWV